VSETPERPRVGVGVVIRRGGKVLLGLRNARHGAGTWQFPGGHLEYGESPAECAVREAFEETGLRVTNVRPGPWTSNVFEAEGRHYVTVMMLADCDEGEPELREPDRCAEWRWCEWGEMPGPLFLPVESLRGQGWEPFD